MLAQPQHLKEARGGNDEEVPCAESSQPYTASVLQANLGKSLP